MLQSILESPASWAGFAVILTGLYALGRILDARSRRAKRASRGSERRAARAAGRARRWPRPLNGRSPFGAATEGGTAFLTPRRGSS